MEVGELDIHLRRRNSYKLQGSARPRLPKNLRQLGARGAVTRPGTLGQQGSVVTVTIPGAGGRGTRQELHYLQHEKGQQRTQAPLYGPGARDPQAFVRAAQQDAHQFRLVVSTREDTLGSERTAFIEALMRQVERDMGRSLDWVAANHYDTEHAHTHIVLRGSTDGKALYMAKSYLTHGIRDRADALLLRFGGQRSQETQRYRVDQRYAQERLALNGMVQGGNDPDLVRLTRQHQSSQAQALAGQMGSYRYDNWSTGEVLTHLRQMQAQMQALQQHEQSWHQAQQRRSG